MLLRICLFAAAIIALACLRQYLQKKEDEAQASGGVAYAEMVPEDHPLLAEFCRRYPERTVLLACSEDITNDGEKDLVVISQSGSEITTQALGQDEQGSVWETEPIPAPRENQHIRFMNIDNVGAIETLITGEKNGQVGYAVYRITGGRLVDLYGDGMEDCC